MEHYERSIRKKREIEKTLLALLQQVPYAQINVTRLADRLGISRKNFYDYYSNMDACLHSMIDHIIMDAAIHTTTINTGASDLFQLCIHNLEYWKKHERFLQVIDQNHLTEVLTDRYLQHLMSETRRIHRPETADDGPEDEDILYFYANGMVKLVFRWYRRGFDTPVEEMAAKFFRIFQESRVLDNA